MENVAVTTLEIKGTEKVATSMKELKQQITDYRNELVALGQIENKNEQQMEEQTRVIEKLRKATKLLSDVTNAHKNAEGQLNKAIDLNTGSYNELQAEMSKLKKLYKDMSAMERDSEFGQETLKTISELDVKLKELDAGMGQYQRNVGNYGQTFEESMNQARQSSGYLSQGIGTLNGILALSGNSSEGLTKALTGATLALQVMQNEGVSKLLVKLKEMVTAKIAARAAAKAQAASAKATATAMGAEAVATNGATTATNLFKKALIATGIGAIIVLIGTLVSKWDDFKKILGGSTIDLEAATEALEQQGKAISDNIEMMKAKGATTEQVLSEEVKQLSKLAQQYEELALDMLTFWTLDEYTEAREKANEKQKEFNDLLLEGERHLRGIVAAGNRAWETRYMSEYERQLADLNAQYQQMQQLRKDLFMEGGLSNGTEFIDLGNEIDAWYQQQRELIEEGESQRKDAIISANREAESKAAKDAAAARDKTLADLEAYEQAALELEEDYSEFSLENQEWAILEAARISQKAREEEKRLQQEKMDALNEEVLALADATMEEVALREEQLAEEKRIAAERKKVMVDSAMSTASATSSMLGSIADSIEALSDNQDAAAEKTKALRVAATTIDTIAGATGAYMQAASTIPPPAGVIVGATQAAAVLATGMANIAKMKATSLSSLSSPSFSSPSASVSAPNVPTQLDAVRNLTSASEEERLNRMAQSQKVYILQSDIEAAGAASKVQVTESTF